MRQLDEPTTTLVEEAANAGVDENTTVGMIKTLDKKGISPQEVLNNLYKMKPPYSQSAIMMAMALTLKEHRWK